MAISSQKLLPGSSDIGAITPIRSNITAKIKPISFSARKTQGKKIPEIKKKVIEIDKLLKGSVITEKKRIEKERKEKQKAARREKEDKLESNITKKENKKGGLKVPKIGFFDRVKKFIMTTLLGFVLFRLIEFAPLLEKIVPFIAGVIDFVSNVVLGIIDGLGTFLSWGFKAYEDGRKKIDEWGGEDAAKKFDLLGDKLFDLLNAIAIVGMVSASLSGKGTKDLLRREAGLKPKPAKPIPKTNIIPRTGGGMGQGPPTAADRTRNARIRSVQKKLGPEARNIYENALNNGKTPSQAQSAVNRALDRRQITARPGADSLASKTAKPGSVMKGGLKKAPKRLATQILGKAGLKTVKGLFGRIPILGPIVVAVASLLAGEPIGQALFKGLGAAVGGFLGSFIPIPILGTMLGETLGTFFGDLLYSLILGGGPKEAGEKLSTAITNALNVGGLIVDFFKSGISRFIDTFFEKSYFDLPNFGGIRSVATTIANFTKTYDFFRDRGYAEGDTPPFQNQKQISKYPNLLNLYNPLMVVPMLGAAFFPDIFGKKPVQNPSPGTVDGETDERKTSRKASTTTQTAGPQSGMRPEKVAPSGKAGMNINDKGSAIYLHWTAGNYNSTYGPYHTVFTGDGTMHRKFEYGKSTGGHTYNRNGGGSIGLSLAANPDIGQWPTEEQRVAMAKEGARIATKWGWTKGDITTKKVMTHGEAGSNIDGYNAHTNYGPFGRGRSDTDKTKDAASVGRLAAVERWDLDKLNSHKDLYGSGGDEMRRRIKGFMRMGGATKGRGLYMMAEEGKEYVIDADSTKALEGTFPGLLRALNKAEGKDAPKVLSQYASYDMAEVIPIPVVEFVPVATPTAGNNSRSNKISVPGPISADETHQDSLYRGG